MKEIIVNSEDVLKRLDIYLTSIISDSRNFISKNIKNGNITVNNNIVKGGYLLKENDVIRINDLTVDSTVKAEDIPLEILYEDDYIFAVN